jgi:hypothetical protein
MNAQNARQTVSAESERNTPTAKFCSELVDIRDSDGRRINVVNHACALHLLSTGQYEAVGRGTVKFLRPVTRPRAKTVFAWTGARRGSRFSEAESRPGISRS